MKREDARASVSNGVRAAIATADDGEDNDHLRERTCQPTRATGATVVTEHISGAKNDCYVMRGICLEL